MPGRCGIRIGLGTRRDRDQPVRPIGVQAVSDRQATQPGFAHGVGGDHAEEFVERTAAGLDRSGEDVALGGPVALGDGERGQLVPEEEEAAEPREDARVQPARLHRGHAVLPEQAPGDRVAVQQDDQRAVGPRRDRSRCALDRHDRLEVERTLGLEGPGLGQEVVERVGGDGTTWRPRAFHRLEPASSASIAAAAAASGPSCPLSAIVPMRTLGRTSSSGSPSSAATAAVNSSASGSTRRIAVQKSSLRSMWVLDSRVAA